MGTLSSELAEALDLEEGMPAMAQDVLDRLASKWKALWRRARNQGLDALPTRDKLLLVGALERAAEMAGYETPKLRARAVDQVLAFAT
jgi:hypothetical protein